MAGIVMPAHLDPLYRAFQKLECAHPARSEIPVLSGSRSAGMNDAKAGGSLITFIPFGTSISNPSIFSLA